MSDIAITVGAAAVTPTPKFTGIRIIHIAGGTTAITLPQAVAYEGGPLLVCCLDDSAVEITYDDNLYLDGVQSTVIAPTLNANGTRNGAAVLLWPDEVNGYWFGLSSGTWHMVA